LTRSTFSVTVLPPPTSLETTAEDYSLWLGVTPETDAVETIEALKGEIPDWLIVDHYGLDSLWEGKLRPYVGKIMVIDDLVNRNHNCDLLLNQNLLADLDCRYDHYLPVNCVRLLGPTYALLQDSYKKLHNSTLLRTGPVQRILVFFGATDKYDFTGQTISAFLALERTDIALDVVLSKTSPHADGVRSSVQGRGNIIVHDSLPSLAPLMVRADLAIGAGGATSWERCCLGLPSVIVTVADNQISVAQYMDQQGLIYWLGHYNRVSEIDLKLALERLINKENYIQWSEKCKKVVDGRGVERVCKFLQELD